jgi:hypothetical protein
MVCCFRVILVMMEIMAYLDLPDPQDHLAR